MELSTQINPSQDCEYFRLQGKQGAQNIPLKKQMVNATIFNSICTINLTHIYQNDLGSAPIETILLLPKYSQLSVGRLKITIDDKQIQCKVSPKQAAKDKYADAVAGGNSAILMVEKKKKQALSIYVGNLLPGQTATVEIQLLGSLQVEGDAYAMVIPASFLVPNVESQIEILILTNELVTYLSTPSNTKVLEQIQKDGQHILQVQHQGIIESNNKDFTVYFRTQDISKPCLLVQESANHPDELACMISLTPTFLEKKSGEHQLEVQENEKPEPQDIETEDNYFFIFIVDRSGSMSGEKMQITNQAIKLFLQSLPVGSKFEIISFGSEYSSLSNTFLNIEATGGIMYNDKNLQEANLAVSKFEADFGGTTMGPPLKQAMYGIPQADKFLKKIFLLTDGDADDQYKVLELAGQSEGMCNIHTFGVGHGCNEKLVHEIAMKGRGSSYIVRDTHNLRSVVINALSKSMEPYLKKCQVQLSGGILFESPQTEQFVYRNQMKQYFAIVKKQKDSEGLSTVLIMQAYNQKEEIKLAWKQSDFYKLEQGEELFKIAAKSFINNCKKQAKNHQNIEELSIRYQVLAKPTAFIGVLKQDQKSSEELISVSIPPEPPQAFYSKYQPEDEEEEDCDMGGLFGDDDGDCCYGSSAPQQYYKSAAVPQKQMYAMQEECEEEPDMGGLFGDDYGCEVQCEQIAYAPMMSAAFMPPPMPGASAPPLMSGTPPPMSGTPPPMFSMPPLPPPPSMANLSQMSGMPPPPPMSSMLPQMPGISGMSTSLPGFGSMPAPMMSSSLSSSKQQEVKTIESSIKFDDLVFGFSSEGYWNNDKLLQKFIDNIGDQSAFDTVKSQVSDKAKLTNVWLTLVALYILEKNFSKQQDEWKLIAKKAKAYLKNAGIQKPEAILSSLQIVI